MKKEPRSLEKELPGWVGGALVLGTLALVLWREMKHPLRKQKHDKLRRDSRNVAMALLSATAIRLTEKPVVGPLSHFVQRKKWGLVKRMNLPPWAEAALAIALMDYTLYVWHVLTHKVPFLARFHRVHHADLDMDATTAIRFHFGEMMLSVPWRAAQVAVIGVSPFSLSLWTALTTAAILFHHSNSKLPIAVERWLCRLIVTPRYHGIHHSIIQDETDANWGTIFSWPDFLHGTVRLDIPQDAITIGVPAFRDEEGLTLGKLIPMPVTEGNPAEDRPEDTKTRKTPDAIAGTMLAA